MGKFGAECVSRGAKVGAVLTGQDHIRERAAAAATAAAPLLGLAQTTIVPRMPFNAIFRKCIRAMALKTLTGSD